MLRNYFISIVKNLLIFIIFIFFIISPNIAQAKNFISIVNPVRGADFWSEKDQSPQAAVLGEMAILKKQNLEATWLIRFDGLLNEKIIELLKPSGDEKGLFLEITPTWSENAKVNYNKSGNWHSAGSAFLTGYSQDDRIKLIDSAFEKFKTVFGFYPKSVGAWYIDSFSLDYMQKKYAIGAALIVADQYTTDNYQIWGQYWSYPYYPNKKNTLVPAQSLDSKIPLVIIQWAARDPLNGYGDGVQESTYSFQANDYLDYHKLGAEYFSKLIDIFLGQKYNLINQVVVGLENSYSWDKYKDEYGKQIEVLASKQKNGQLIIETMSGFSKEYQNTFPQLSPSQIIVADDPLGTFKKVVWFMNPYFRAGWFYNEVGSVFRDIRQYIDGQEELCFQKICDRVNFATSATRVLDEVSFGNRWVIDQGKLTDFKVIRNGEKYVINYKNEALNDRTIEFLPRDISLDGQVTSIDTTILNAIKTSSEYQNSGKKFEKGKFQWNILEIISASLKFFAFLFLVCLIPGFNIISKPLEKNSLGKRIFLALILGLVSLTITFYVLSIFHLRFLIYLYVFINLFLFLKLKLIQTIRLDFSNIRKWKLLLMSIVGGTIFQVIPTIRSGLIFPYGMGFWGPNTHDGIWHIALINELVKNVPPQNPIFAGNSLKNYHFFYDLLIASTTFFTKISVIDLIFRFYPILFSLLLGFGTFLLVISLLKEGVKDRLAVFFSVYFVYFAGSFGWIVEYLKQKSLGGESAFWANQSISFNLNPPFAISLIIVIAIMQLLAIKGRVSVILQIVLIGTLIGFKSYASVLILLTLFIVGILKKNIKYILVFFASSAISAVYLLSNFSVSKQLVIFSPFWFIHSMIDAPDRVGLTRLTLTRTVGLETKNWLKFISAELIGLTLFILGNLGMRIVGLLAFLRIRTIFEDTQLLFALTFSLLSLLIPILFIQSGNPWNTIQFSYYALYIASISSGICLAFIIPKIPKLAAFLIVLAILVLTPINSITTATYYLGNAPHGLIDAKELDGLKFLSKQEDGIVLTYPYIDKLKKIIAEPWPLFVYDSTGYVSALSNKAAYLEDEGQNQILLTDYKKRLVSSKDFFKNQSLRGRNFLADNKIKYIYLPKKLNIGVDESSIGVINIFENDEVIIYKIRN